MYYNATYQKNRHPPHYLPGRYSTDVLAESAVEFLEDAVSDKDHRPFFINIMPIGPHFELSFDSETSGGGSGGGVVYPPVPAKRHEHLFPNVTVPRTENFNPETVRACSRVAPTHRPTFRYHELILSDIARCCQLSQIYSKA